MFMKILLLIVVLLQITVCVITFFQFKKQNVGAMHFFVALLWGIAVCVNLLYLLYLRDLLKSNMVEYDIPNDEIIIYKNLLVGFGGLLIMEIVYLFFRYSKHMKRGKWLNYLSYFVYIALISVLVVLFVMMIDVYKAIFIFCILEGNIIAIIADVIESVNKWT